MHNYQEMSEEEIIQAFRQEDSNAAGEIYRRYYPHLLDQCRRHLRSREDGEDAVQEVFCKVLLQKKLLDFRGESKLWSWLKRIAENECNEMIRKRARMREKSYVHEETYLPLEEILPANEPTPEEQVVRAEEIAHLHRFIQQLAVYYQNALSIVCLGEHSYKEAARLLGVKVVAVGRYVNRGKKHLRNLLVNYFAEAAGETVTGDCAAELDEQIV